MASDKRRAWSEFLELDRIIDSRTGTGRDSRAIQNEGLGRKWVVLRTSFSGICARYRSRRWDLSEKYNVNNVLISQYECGRVDLSGVDLASVWRTA